MAGGVELGIDHLTEVELTGRGGFSVVYAATDTTYDRRVAVKVLNRLVSDTDRRDFHRQRRAMGRVSPTSSSRPASRAWPRTRS